MKIRASINFNFKVRCPHCHKDFPFPVSPGGDTISGSCPSCGSPFNFPNTGIMKAFEKRAGTSRGAAGEPGDEEPASPKSGNPVLAGAGSRASKPAIPPEIARFKTPTLVFNIFACVIALWAFLFPVPYLWAVTLCSAMPLVSIVIAAASKRRILLIDEGKYGRAFPPQMTLAFSIPSVVLAFRGLDVNLVSYERIWQPMLFIGIPMLVASYTILKKNFVIYLAVLSIVLAYSYGMMVELNCGLDRSRPTLYKTVVLEKRVSSGKTRTRYLKVAPWGPMMTETEFHVSRRTYDKTSVNDTIPIILRDGFLGIQWYKYIPPR